MLSPKLKEATAPDHPQRRCQVFGRAFALAHKKPLSCYRPFLGSDRRRWRRVMRYLFTATAAVAVLLATGSASNRARAADVGPPYGPPSAYGLPDDYGHPSDYAPPPRPPRAIPYAVSSVRPACDLEWRCGLRACGWRRV